MSAIRVEIVTPLYNGARFLDDFLAGLGAQTHEHWRLWLRDDGSTDGTLALARAAAAADPRIRLLEDDSGARLGPTAGFDWLMDRVPADGGYVMCADQDDVWRPEKIERTLAAMTHAEAGGAGPLLVHTDLEVVDADLRVIDRSYWRYAGVDPEPVSLRRLIVQNVATGATVMLNRELRSLAGRVPPGAVYHDWWYACVAAAFGRIVPVREATVLYRQHDANAVGLPRRPPRWHEVPRIAWVAMGRSAQLRSDVARTARQAAAFLERYGSRLGESDRRFLEEYARLPELPFFRRKVALARLRLRREHGLWRNIGILARA